MLGVLRRPATTEDALPPRVLARERNEVFVRYIRRARVASGQSYYVVPTFHVQCAPLKPVEVITLWSLGAKSPGGQVGAPTATVFKNAGGLFGSFGTGASKNLTVAGVVPDGVASVTLHYAAIRANSAGPAAQSVTVTAQVVNNVVLETVPQGAVVAESPTIIWRAANGHVIKKFSQP